MVMVVVITGVTISEDCLKLTSVEHLTHTTDSRTQSRLYSLFSEYFGKLANSYTDTYRAGLTKAVILTFFDNKALPTETQLRCHHTL